MKKTTKVEAEKALRGIMIFAIIVTIASLILSAVNKDDDSLRSGIINLCCLSACSGCLLTQKKKEQNKEDKVEIEVRKEHE